MKHPSLLFSLSLLLVSGLCADSNCAPKDCAAKCVKYRSMCPDCKECPSPDEHKSCRRPDCMPMDCEDKECEPMRGETPCNKPCEEPSRMCMNESCRCENCPCEMRDMPSRKCACGGKKPNKSAENEATEDENAE